MDEPGFYSCPKPKMLSTLPQYSMNKFEMFTWEFVRVTTICSNVNVKVGVLVDSAFFKDSSVVGQNCQRVHFLVLPPPPKIVCDHRRCEPSTAGSPTRKFKIWVSEIAFPAF